jgi:hypothetical protein
MTFQQLMPLCCHHCKAVCSSPVAVTGIYGINLCVLTKNTVLLTSADHAPWLYGVFLLSKRATQAVISCSRTCIPLIKIDVSLPCSQQLTLHSRPNKQTKATLCTTISSEHSTLLISARNCEQASPHKAAIPSTSTGSQLHNTRTSIKPIHIVLPSAACSTLELRVHPCSKHVHHSPGHIKVKLALFIHLSITWQGVWGHLGSAPCIPNPEMHSGVHMDTRRLFILKRC